MSIKDKMAWMSADRLMGMIERGCQADFNARNRAAYAKIEIKDRIARGAVNDMDHERAEALGLI